MLSDRSWKGSTNVRVGDALVNEVGDAAVTPAEGVPEGYLPTAMATLEEVDAWEALVPQCETIVRGDLDLAGVPTNLILLVPGWFAAVVGIARVIREGAYPNAVAFAANFIGRNGAERIEACYRLRGVEAVMQLLEAAGP